MDGGVLTLVVVVLCPFLPSHDLIEDIIGVQLPFNWEERYDIAGFTLFFLAFLMLDFFICVEEVG